MIYLACPYSHPNELVRNRRYEIANAVAVDLVKKGFRVFSPISHSHVIAGLADMAHDECWVDMDLKILTACEEVCVITLDGWEESKGVSREIQEAHRLSIPVSYISPVAPAPAHSRFYELVKEMCRLHDQKNADYAHRNPLSNLRQCEKVGIPPYLGVIVRMMDKWNRIENLAVRPPVEVTESLHDTLMDNAVYSLLCRILLEEHEREKGE